jgi:hypothetical protein
MTPKQRFNFTPLLFIQHRDDHFAAPAIRRFHFKKCSNSIF